MPSCTVEQLSSSLTKVVKLYIQGGFVVHLVLMDMEFEKIRDKFDKVEINTTAMQEYFCKIERLNQTVKERSRGTISEMRDMGFNFFHKMIIVHIIYFVVKLLNAVPARLGISEQHDPVEIVL